MARNNDSFDFDDFKSKEKKEKTIKVKKTSQSNGESFFSRLFGSKDGENFNFRDENGRPKNLKAMILIAVAIVVVVAVVITVIAIVTATGKANNEINGIFISSTPNNTIYYVADEVDYEGLIVKATRRNGESFVVDLSECVITGFDSSKANDNLEISVNYEGYVAKFSVVIKETQKPTPILVSIRLETLPKTEYKVGEWLETNGGVIVREYKDGSTSRLGLVNSYIYGWEEAYEGGPGTYTLTVMYVEDAVLTETTYDITITE